MTPEQARAELVRRYLCCYGPSTVKHFAEWAGIAPAQAARAWADVDRELIPMDYEGRATWLQERDLPHFRSPAKTTGIRYLPPHDPYLQLRDRSTLVPDRSKQHQIWRSSGNPGIVLVEGRLTATWRPRKERSRLRMAVECFAPVSQAIVSRMEAEAATLAPYRGCRSVEVQIR